MTEYFYAHQIRIFDYPRWAQPLRDAIRENAERLAKQNQIEIEFLRSRKNGRKEDRVKEILEQRGDKPGLVCILSAMEPCSTYQPWHNKKNHRTYLKPDDGKCLHYYFYFIDQDLDLCSLRVPTWCPFRLQFYCNGHSYLARQMRKRGIEYRVWTMHSAGSRTSKRRKSWLISSKWNCSTTNWTSLPSSIVRWLGSSA
jgi:hypothetical protein